MKRQPFTSYILEKNLLPREKYQLRASLGSNAINTVVKDALLIAHENFRSGVAAKRFSLHGKAVYSTDCLKEKAILRHCASNLHQALGLNIKQRSIIIDEVKKYLKEGSTFKIYRLDIKRFFESINIELLLKKIENNINISRHTRNLVEWYIKICKIKFNNPGLPRGLEISPIMSEIYLIEFDKAIKESVHILYYSRFVDDIIIISKGKEDESRFLIEIKKLLPPGLEINESKHKKFISPVIKERSQGANPSGTELYKFDLLGYEIKIINSFVPTGGRNAHKAIYRDVKINFSEKRLKKFKTRISRAFYSYNKTGDFLMLSDRLKFLTSNRGIKRQVKGYSTKNKKTISTGIYYSNSRLDCDSHHLKELDSFLFYCIEKITARINKNRKTFLSKHQRESLLRNSFRTGFNKRIHISFSFKRCSEITKIWS